MCINAKLVISGEEKRWRDEEMDRETDGQVDGHLWLAFPEVLDLAATLNNCLHCPSVW